MLLTRDDEHCVCSGARIAASKPNGLHTLGSSTWMTLRSRLPAACRHGCLHGVGWSHHHWRPCRSSKPAASPTKYGRALGQAGDVLPLISLLVTDTVASLFGEDPATFGEAAVRGDNDGLVVRHLTVAQRHRALSTADATTLRATPYPASNVVG